VTKPTGLRPGCRKEAPPRGSRAQRRPVSQDQPGRPWRSGYASMCKPSSRDCWRTSSRNVSGGRNHRGVRRGWSHLSLGQTACRTGSARRQLGSGLAIIHAVTWTEGRFATIGVTIGVRQLGSGLAIIHAVTWTEGRFVRRAHWGSPAAALIRLVVRYASKIPQILSSRRKNQPSRAKARLCVGACQGKLGGVPPHRSLRTPQPSGLHGALIKAPDDLLAFAS